MNSEKTHAVDALGVPGAFQDTTLELRDGNGALLAFYDGWITDREEQIPFSKEAPADARESALVQTPLSCPFNVVVRGKDETVGIALFEVYVLQ